MGLRKPFLGVTLAALLGASAAQVAACSSSSPSAVANEAGPDSQVSAFDPVCTQGGLQIAFNPMYSAYDGKHIFKIPAVVYGSNEEVTWTADTSMVEMQIDSDLPNEVLIQVLNSGFTMIEAQSADGKCAVAPLTISPATAADWAIGNARYNDGTSLHLDAVATSGTGSALEMSDGSTGGPACTNCHGETAQSGAFRDVSHTPEQTGGFSDDDLLNIILRGTFPKGAYFDTSIVTYAYWQMFHRWTDIQPDQQRGIITYLRSLTPVPQKGQPIFTLPPAPDAGAGPKDASKPSESGLPDAPSEGDAPGADSPSQSEASEADDSGAG